MPERPTAYEEQIVLESLQEFAELQAWRSTSGQHWEEVAELILPTSRNTFFYGNYNYPGVKKTDKQIDSTGALALSRFGAICDSILTPRNMLWHGLRAVDDQLMKSREVRLWFEKTVRTLFRYRYAPNANFSAQNQNSYQNLGAFGTQALLIDEFDYTNWGGPGIRYKSVPLGELFLRENHQGLVDGFCRWFRLTARQAKQKWPDTFPSMLQPALEKGSQQLFDFLMRVCPRSDYEARRLDAKGKRFAAYYICLTSKTFLEESGYRMLPIACSRYEQTPGEIYGRSPAMMVLPALKTLNAEKRTFLKQGHRAADPVLLTADDGIVDLSLRPGAMNKGGVNSDGKLLVQTLPTGNIQVTHEMMQEEKSLINDVFMVSLFQILTETPTMTATEVIERTNEKGILLAPTLGRQQSEYLGPMIDREIDVLSAQGLLDPMPPLLREARGEYEMVNTSPLARAMRAQEAAGFMRTVESVKELVNITQDSSLLDPFNFDVAVPEIADIQSVPVSWMATTDEIAAKRKGRAQAQARQQQIQAMPAQAAMMKAQAVVQKNQPGIAPGEQGLGGPVPQQQGQGM